MHILLVYKRMGIGGAETMMMNVLRTIDRSKYEFDFVVHTSEKGEFDDEIKSLGCKILVCPSFKNNISAYKKWWRKLFETSHYDLVHGNYRQTAIIYLKEAKKKGIRTVFHTHSASTRSSFSWLRFLASKIIYKQSDRIFACSEKAATWLFGDRILHDRKLRIIYNGIDTSLFSYDEVVRQNYRKKLQVDDKLVVCHVGRFAPVKNHQFLLRIFNEIKKIRNDSCLLLIGAGELKEQMEDIVKNEGISDVHFLGIRTDISSCLLSLSG